MQQLPYAFFDHDAVTVARGLLGKVVKKGACAGVIVETEAYALDEASHAVKKREQGRLMRETVDRWYIYFTYGMHWCANVTCDARGAGAVLIRAVKPIAGIEEMRRRRGVEDARRLATGPARFAEAFGIGKTENGAPLARDFGIFGAPPIADEMIVAAPRVGITRAVELPWRFYIKDNPYVSKLPKMKSA
ncbi:MAG: DNA-3-methyladenine glycosylase [Patescibacteria group bacterium]|nr:DNA-3-methyladenine glycosylase [Patescibacteria group bacterium]MDE1944261.1 DNA-3-methyladenine glycosylase [Patescibacteria group bacterium]MDE1945171.1 DNA-3-methyladenine glycosylase [Patescibacteria group bacterium]MDE2057858.1 DNA-3-methyladenine glycosylase [Patescibacteria group bacterium]